MQCCCLWQGAVFVDLVVGPAQLRGGLSSGLHRVAQNRTLVRINRVGHNRIYTPNMTVYLVISLPKTPHIYTWFWPTLMIRCFFRATCAVYIGCIHRLYTCAVYIGCIHVLYTCAVYMCCIHRLYTCAVYMCFRAT